MNDYDYTLNGWKFRVEINDRGSYDVFLWQPPNNYFTPYTDAPKNVREWALRIWKDITEGLSEECLIEANGYIVTTTRSK